METPDKIVAVIPPLAAPGEKVRIVVNFPLKEDPKLYAVLFGRRSARIDTVTPVSESSLWVWVPEGLNPGEADVTVYAGGKTITLANGFEVEQQSGFISEIFRSRPGFIALFVFLIISLPLIPYYILTRQRHVTERVRWQAELEIKTARQQAERELKTALQEAERLRLQLDRSSTSVAQAGTSPEILAMAPPQTSVAIVVPVLPDELISACSGGQCVLFAGAGLGAQAGYPTWKEALDRLIDHAATNDSSERWSDVRRALDTGQLTLVAELLATRLQRPLLIEELIKLYGARPAELPPVWRALAALPFSNVLTSTWDPLVDLALETRSESRPVTVTPWSTEKLPQLLNENAFCIVRLWGDVQDGRIVFTDDEYRAALKENPLWARYLTTLALSRPHLFVGTSLTTIEQYLSGFPQREASVRHYALVPDGDGMQLQQERFLTRYGVQLIIFTPTPGWPEVAAAAEELRTAVGHRSPTGQQTDLQVVTLSGVTLKNIGAFEEFSLDFRPGWNVLLGNNGLGKSTLLKAIALGLCGDDVKAAVAGGRLLRANQLKGLVQLQVGRESYQTDLVNEAESIHVRCEQVTPLQHGRWIVLGFPPLRGISTQDPTGTTEGGSSKPTVDDLLPLLAGPTDVRLNNLKQWLVNLDARSRVGNGVTEEDAERNNSMRNTFFNILQRFTPGVRIRFHAIKSGKVEVETDDGIVSIDQISQGLGSIIGWLGTLLQRMYEIHRKSLAPEKEAAIVLIDEIDAHLHPQWQQILVKVVKEVFPATQFIVTTHSPLIVAGLMQDEVLILRRGGSSERRITVTRPPSDLKGWRVDQILTGEAFGLGGARDLDTVETLDRYSELMGKYPRSTEEEQELRELAGKLELELPPAESQHRARQAYEIIASAMNTKLDEVPKDERQRLNAEIKSQIQEIVTGERRPS